MARLVYYSSATGNTHHFVQQLETPLSRLVDEQQSLVIQEPYVLVTSTYADGKGRGAVPKAVIRFLNEADNRKWLRGVIAGGNRNFGWAYALAGKVVAEKCKVPFLYRFELRGTSEDVNLVRDGLEKLWKTV